MAQAEKMFDPMSRIRKAGLRTGSFVSAASFKHRLACSRHSFGSVAMTSLPRSSNHHRSQNRSCFSSP